MKRKYPLTVAAETCCISVDTITRFIAFAWVNPSDRDSTLLDQEDLARIRLIYELQHDFGINDEAVPIILHLIDQLNLLQLTAAKIDPEKN
jgi:chaperone modulatory protein CbpM